MELFSGEILYVVNIFLKFKKEPLEWLQILEWEIPVVNYLKTANFAPFFSKYFFFTYVCSEK